MRTDAIDLPLPFESKAHEALVSMWWTGMLLKQESRSFFGSSGTTEMDFHLMMLLKYSENPLTQQAISDRLLIDKANMTGRIDKLEQAGVVRRKAVKGDRRSFHITLTRKGRRLIDSLDHEYTKRVATIMRPFTLSESKELARLVRKLREGLAVAREGDR